MPRKDPKAPKRKRGRPRIERHIENYAALGPPPTDSLEANKWAFRMNLVAMHQVAIDVNLSDKDRRIEIARHSRTLVQLTPHNDLHDAIESLKDDAEDMEHTDDPKLEDAPDLDS